MRSISSKEVLLHEATDIGQPPIMLPTDIVTAIVVSRRGSASTVSTTAHVEQSQLIAAQPVTLFIREVLLQPNVAQIRFGTEATPHQSLAQVQDGSVLIRPVTTAENRIEFLFDTLLSHCYYYCMKGILRSLLFIAFSLFILQQLFSGLSITSGMQNVLIAAGGIFLVTFITKPVSSILTLPVAFIFGIATIMSNTLALFIVSHVWHGMHIHAFRWPGIHVSGFAVPGLAVNTFMAYILFGLLLWLMRLFLDWIATE